MEEDDEVAVKVISCQAGWESVFWTRQREKSRGNGGICEGGKERYSYDLYEDTQTFTTLMTVQVGL